LSSSPCATRKSVARPPSPFRKIRMTKLWGSIFFFFSWIERSLPRLLFFPPSGILGKAVNVHFYLFFGMGETRRPFFFFFPSFFLSFLIKRQGEKWWREFSLLFPSLLFFLYHPRKASMFPPSLLLSFPLPLSLPEHAGHGINGRAGKIVESFRPLPLPPLPPRVATSYRGRAVPSSPCSMSRIASSSPPPLRRPIIRQARPSSLFFSFSFR